MNLRSALVVALASVSVLTAGAELSWNRKMQAGSGQELLTPYLRLTGEAPRREAPTQGFTLERPAFKLVLGPGTFFQEAGEAGVDRALYYEGKGSVSFEVSPVYERRHLKNFCGSETLKEVPVAAVLILPLGACADLPRVAEGTLRSGAQAEYARFKNAFHAEGTEWLAKAMNVRQFGPEDLLVLFRMGDHIWAYRLDSTEVEEVALLRLGTPPRVESWRWDAVVSLHRTAQGQLVAAQTLPEVRAQELWDTLRYEAALRFDTEGRLIKGTTARVKARLLKPTRVLRLYLLSDFTVSAVRLRGGSRAPFLKEDYSETYFYEDPGLLVFLPEEMTGEIEVEVDYEGKLCEPDLGFRTPRTQTHWLPFLPDLDGAEFSLTFSAPKGWEALTVGALVSDTPEGEDRHILAFELKGKSPHAPICYGKFHHVRGTSEGVALDLAVPEGTIVDDLLRQRQGVALKQLQQSVETMTKLYGPLGIPELRVGIVPGGLSLATPGFLLIGYGVLEDIASFKGKAIISHEVAHQWWGPTLPPLTYRDIWIRESLAEFSSFLYVKEREGVDKMREHTGVERAMLLRDSAILKTPLADFGPAILGPRLATALDPDNPYQQVTYTKMAWMLLSMSKMAAFLKSGEGAFFDGLKEFRTAPAGRPVTTLEFQRTLERHMKLSLEPYFKENLELAGVPKVKVTTKVEEGSPEPKLVVEGSQKGSLTLAIPIQIRKKDQWHEFLFPLTKTQSRQEYPLPFKPDKVFVDGNRYCLAEYE